MAQKSYLTAAYFVNEDSVYTVIVLYSLTHSIWLLLSYNRAEPLNRRNLVAHKV